MLIKDKLNLGSTGLKENGPINIVAFGDSVTHGALFGCNNYETVYWNLLKKKLNELRNYMPVNVINAGIGGVSAKTSLYRIERDVTSHHPDLVIVCFGLNDVNNPKEEYIESLRIIFSECKKCGAEVIFMTPNMLNTYVSDDAPDELKEYAAITAKYQNEGKMDDFISSAIDLAKEMDVKVCDCYGEWKNMQKNGIDTTKFLINYVNHPTPKMHELFADMLFELILDSKEYVAKDYSNTMYSKDE